MLSRSSKISLIALLLAATMALQPRLARAEVACLPADPCAELPEPTGQMACCEKAAHAPAPPAPGSPSDESTLPDCCYLKHIPAEPLTSSPAVVPLPPPDALFLPLISLPVIAAPGLTAVSSPPEARDPPWRIDARRIHAPRGPPTSL